jgi:hypothetical protein
MICHNKLTISNFKISKTRPRPAKPTTLATKGQQKSHRVSANLKQLPDTQKPKPCQRPIPQIIARKKIKKIRIWSGSKTFQINPATGS